MAVLSMPYSVLRGDFWMTNNDENHHKGVHIFNVLLMSPLLILSWSSDEVIPFVLHIMYNACKIITQ